MYTSAIVLAAGKGTRLKSNISKPLLKVNSRPLIIYSLGIISQIPLIKEIIVVANPFNIHAIAEQIKRYKITKVKSLVLGGKRRQDSVRNGLSEISLSADLVLIHDAARPFIEKDKVSLLIRQAAKCGASILAVPVKATIKKVKIENSPAPLNYNRKRDPVKREKLKIQKNKFENHIVAETLDRNSLWEVQTPQAFKKDVITKAYDKFGNLDVTDDASLVEKSGGKVNVVLGSYNNIKITTPEDLALAEAILKIQKSRFKGQKF